MRVRTTMSGQTQMMTMLDVFRPVNREGRKIRKYCYRKQHSDSLFVTVNKHCLVFLILY